jgi:hypothetical protein
MAAVSTCMFVKLAGLHAAVLLLDSPLHGGRQGRPRRLGGGPGGSQASGGTSSDGGHFNSLGGRQGARRRSSRPLEVNNLTHTPKMNRHRLAG